MTTIYSAYYTAAFTANSDTLAIEIDTPANTTCKIRRIRITDNDGTKTTTNDYHRKVKLIRESTGGTGGASFTAIDLDDNNTASVCTVKTGLTAIGTISSTVETLSIHSNIDYHWQAADEDDKIVVKPGEAFGIVVNPAN